MKKDPNEYPFPVYGTQGGGLVRAVGDCYIFVEAPPNFPELTIGSEMPPEWGLAPANKLAQFEDDELWLGEER